MDLDRPGVVALVRMANLGLAPGWAPDAGPAAPDPGPPPARLASVVSRIGALQSQHWGATLHALAMRTPDHSLATARRAFDDGLLVRTWAMRGTLHTVAAADLPWLLAATRPRMDRQTARRRSQLQISDDDLRAAAAIAVRALSRRRLSRRQLVGAWRDEGLIGRTPGRGYHIFMTLCYRGVLALGPTAGDGDQSVVRLDLPELMTDPYPVWVRRYFEGHGPATLDDLARWSGLTKSSLRPHAAGAVERRQLARGRMGGQQAWYRPDLDEIPDEVLQECRRTTLLSGYDELILGYRDRSCTIAAAQEPLICPGGNGVYRNVIVENGRVVGTWRLGAKGRPGVGDPAPEWFEPPTGRQRRAFDLAAARLPA